MAEVGPYRRDLEQVVLEARGPMVRGGGMIRVELIKMLRRPRTWMIIGMLVALPTLVAILLAVTDLGPRPGTGPPFLSAVLSDGTLFPLAALGVVLPLFLPIAVAVLGGDAIAGETQTGTLRYLLVRPGRAHPPAGGQAGHRGGLRGARRARGRAVSYVEGRLLLGQAPATGTRQPQRIDADPAGPGRAHGARRSATSSSRCWGSRPLPCSCPR